MYRYFSADLVFTFDNCLKKNYVVVVDSNNCIADIYHIDQHKSDTLEYFDGIICPGFFNSHNHLELSYVNIEKVDSLEDFLFQISQKDKQAFDQNELFEVDKKMYNEGVSFCADISNTDSSFYVKKKSKITYHTFLEIFSSNSSFANSVFKNAIENLSNLKKIELSASINLHSLYSISEELFELYKSYITENKHITSIHLMENFKEIYPLKFQQEILNRLKSSYIAKFSNYDINISFLELIFDIFSATTQVLFVHCINLDLKNAEILLKYYKNSYICVCPTSNLFIEKRMLSAEILQKFKNRLLIGTDSIASNKKMSILHELFLLQQNSNLSMEEILKVATFNAANFFGVSKNFGSIEIGKSPGLVNIKNVDLQNLKLTNRSEAKRII